MKRWTGHTARSAPALAPASPFASAAGVFALSLSALAAVAAVAAVPQAAQAAPQAPPEPELAVVYDNGPASASSPEAHNMTGGAIADDFWVDTSLSFDAIRLYAIDTVAGLVTNFSGTLSWFVYADSRVVAPDSFPSSNLVASGTTSDVNVVATGQNLFGNASFEIAEMTFAVPEVSLGAGRYWLQIRENLPSDPNDGTPLYWLATTQAVLGNPSRRGGTAAAPTWSTQNTNDVAFQLLAPAAAAVPEPGSVALMGFGATGLAGAAVTRRRRRGRTPARPRSA